MKNKKTTNNKFERVIKRKQKKMSRRRVSANRDTYHAFEEEGAQKEKRRVKAMQQLVHLGMSRLDDAAASDERGAGPYKPGQVADACFEVAPDGKYKGMKFRKIELMQALRVMAMPSNVELEKSNKDGAGETEFGGDGGGGGGGGGGEQQQQQQQRIFSVASSNKSGQQRYSSYPVDISSLPTSSRRGDRSDREAAYGPNPEVVCGIKIPPQRVLWPTWPDQRAVGLQRVIAERKAGDDAEREKERVSFWSLVVRFIHASGNPSRSDRAIVAHPTHPLKRHVPLFFDCVYGYSLGEKGTGEARAAG